MALTWSISEDRSVWVSANREPPVLIDAPELSDFPPGNYTSAQLNEAGKKIGKDKKTMLHDRRRSLA